MSSLFSIFDSISVLGLPLNWIVVSISVSMIPVNFWVFKNQLKSLFFIFVEYLVKEFKTLTKKTSVPGMTSVSVNMFFFIWLLNLLGLFPYVFTATSHLMFSLSLAMPLWLGHMIYAWMSNFNSSLAHLVPLGSPKLMSPFMVMVEVVSTLIRPLTLAVRLAANMIAGHLLVVLLSTPMASMGWIVASGILISLILLISLELAVASIQAYVFSVLSLLYLGEVDSVEIY